MSSFSRSFVRLLTGVATLLISCLSVFAQTPVAPVPNPCPRFKAGSVIHQPPALFSQNGVLNVRFSYQQTTDGAGRTLFCFMTPNGLENPTLHVKPGDTLNVTVTNNATDSPVVEQVFDSTFSPTCGNTNMTASSMNIHYHGTNTTPACHGDNVVKTLINTGATSAQAQTFQYNVAFPTDEPPGLYWYHPHVHGVAESAVFGGAAGALVVDGIQNVQPAVAGLRHRILVVRDQLTFASLAGVGETGLPPVDGGLPLHDLSVNFVPEDATTTPLQPFPTGVTTYTSPLMHMFTNETMFLRVCNCTSDSILDLQWQFNGVAQNFQIVGIDAVPVNSQDGTQPGHLITAQHYRIPPAGRVEILVTAPSSSATKAQLITQFISTGFLGDEDPTRPLFTAVLTGDSDNDEPALDDNVGNFTGQAYQQKFGGLDSVPVAANRLLYFDEVEDGSHFFMNVVNSPVAEHTLFNNNNPPAIVSTQGTAELWTVQNRARENHELHQHQIHFKVKAQDNFPTDTPTQPAIQNQFMDMIEVPHCTGDAAGLNPDGTVTNPPNPPACTTNGNNPPVPYADVKLLMDFRGPDVGDFVFHCHILGHEDLGMMNIIQVVQNTSKAQPAKDNHTPVADHKNSTKPSTQPAQPSVATGAGTGGGGM